MKSPLLTRAIDLAKRAHTGQVDKAGKPYLDHPLRVMAKMSSDEEKMVAVLHDAVEDSDLSLDELRREGFPAQVIEAIDAITKREGEDYETYLARVTTDRIALTVKIADMTDNMDISRIAVPNDNDRARLDKYSKVLPRLRAALANFPDT
jgi:GTP diphosphokinase / guanosine-3',5'-bis(diphosphate) 3'-diphosphatase